MLKLGYCSLHRNLYETNKVGISIIIDRSRFSNSRFPQNYSLVFFFETTIDSLQLSEKSTLTLGFWTFHQMSRQLKRPKNIILVTSYWYSLIARTTDLITSINARFNWALPVEYFFSSEDRVRASKQDPVIPKMLNLLRVLISCFPQDFLPELPVGSSIIVPSYIRYFKPQNKTVIFFSSEPR